MANFTDPIKAAFGQYVGRFHAGAMSDTPGMRAWTARELSKAAAFVPGRMVDAAEDMLEAWRKNDTSQAARPRPFLPMVLVAMSKDFMPVPAEVGQNRGDAVSVMIPSDPKSRLFKMRTVQAQIRAQLLFAAADEPTARSMAIQFHAFVTSMENRRFGSVFKLAGLDEKWPVQVETPDLLMPSVATEQKNLTMLLADMTLYATVPMLIAPRLAEPNDGKGDGGNQDDPFADGYDPSGYLVVTEANGRAYPPVAGAPADVQWTVR